MAKAEASKVPVCGYVTWTTRQEHHRKFRAKHHTIMVRIVRNKGRTSNNRIISYDNAFDLVEFESFETKVLCCAQRFSFAWTMDGSSSASSSETCMTMDRVGK